MAKAKKGNAVYAVARGRKTGLFKTWEECRNQVNGFPGACYKKFVTQFEAVRFLREYGLSEKGESLPQVLHVPNHMSADGDSHKVEITFDRESLQTKPLVIRDEDGNEIEVEKKLAGSASDTYSAPTITYGELETTDELIYKKVYTDGACRHNGTPRAVAGYGVFFGVDDKRNVARPLEGKEQTNQRAELTALLRCLEIIDRELMENDGKIHTVYKIMTDSQYTINCLTKWWKNWVKKDWKRSDGKSVMNADLIKPSLRLIDKINEVYKRRDESLSLEIEYVVGHSGDMGNDQADRLANQGCDMSMRLLKNAPQINSECKGFNPY